MSCQTCGKTMHSLGQNDRGDNVFLCPICGTVKIDAFGQHGDNVYVPKLVGRCREFEDVAIGVGTLDEDQLKNEWNRRGINEAIHLPENRL